MATEQKTDDRPQRSTVTLRCQTCDNKLVPGIARSVPQVITRSCRGCDTTWRIQLNPRRVTLGGRDSWQFHPVFRAVVPT